jgi:hypothetical protein
MSTSNNALLRQTSHMLCIWIGYKVLHQAATAVVVVAVVIVKQQRAVTVRVVPNVSNFHVILILWLLDVYYNIYALVEAILTIYSFLLLSLLVALVS